VQVSNQRRTCHKERDKHAMKFSLRLIRRYPDEARFPSRAHQHRYAKPYPVSAPQRIPGNQKVKIGRCRQKGIHAQREIQDGRVSRQKNQALNRSAMEHLPSLGIFEVQVDQERRQQAQTSAQYGFCEDRQQCGWLWIVNLRVQRKERTAIEKKQREAQEEKHALKVPLPPVAENHHHPEQLQQRSGGKSYEP